MVFMKKKWLIGVDEAGRGPLAGPVAIGLVLVRNDADLSSLDPKDSKQLSEKRRNEIFNEMRRIQKNGELQYVVSMVGAHVIDRIGITRAVSLGITRGLRRLPVDPSEVHVKLDGLLKAPDIYKSQDTIVKGDVTEPEISLASIAAKVRRDRYMVRMARRYPAYGFELHKGYGTKAHMASIKKYDLCELHRRTYTSSVQKDSSIV